MASLEKDGKRVWLSLTDKGLSISVSTGEDRVQRIVPFDQFFEACKVLEKMK